jgi:hypothetical protein
MFRKQRVEKNYISEIDKRMVKFDRTHSKTASQQAEIKKYQRIFRLRDNPTLEEEKKDIWSE